MKLLTRDFEIDRSLKFPHPKNAGEVGILQDGNPAVSSSSFSLNKSFMKCGFHLFTDFLSWHNILIVKLTLCLS
jgi:hypothetical protein